MHDEKTHGSPGQFFIVTQAKVMYLNITGCAMGYKGQLDAEGRKES